MARTDVSYARRFFANRSDGGSIIGTPGADLIWAGGELVDSWPATPDENDYAQVRDSKVETLLIGGNLDFATPPQWATRDLLPHLPNGHQVVLDDLGHSGDFWTYQPAAGKRLVTTFLDTGTVDDSLYRPATVDFTPAFSHGAVAKIVVGVMLGLARADRASRCCGWPAGCTGEAHTVARRVRHCARCTRSCSASADGSSAS